MGMEYAVAGSRLDDERPHMGGIGGSDLKHGNSHFLGVLGFCHFGEKVDFASSNKLFFLGGLSQIMDIK